MKGAVKMSQKPTKHQHYIPQTYLDGFKSAIKYGKHDTIYQFDKTMSLQSTKPYPIKDIAYENFMYELHDEKGKIVHTNYIERCLGEYESKFNKYRNIMINNFSLHKSCSEDSKEYWTDYIALQLLRTPHAFKVSKKLFKKDDISDIEFQNQALYHHFPFLHEDSSDETLFSYLKSVFKQMHFFIAYARYPSDSIITSDNPVCVIYNNTKFPLKNPLPFELVFFPVTEKFGICLHLEYSNIVKIFQEKGPALCHRNLLNTINSFIFFQAKRFIYSSFQITTENINQMQIDYNNVKLLE